MKKSFLKVLLLLIVLSTFGCANNVTGADNQIKYGSVIVTAAAADNAGRTVMPSTDDDQNFTDIVLKGQYNGQSSTLAEWDNIDGLVRSTQTITLSAGSWTFTLTANRYGAAFKQILSQTVIADKVTQLVFNNMTLTAKSADSGAIDVTVKFPYNLNSTIKTVSAKLDSGENILLDVTTDSYNEYSYDYYSSRTWYFKKATFYADNVTSGSHILTFYAYDENGESVFVYPTYILVKKGSSSKDTIDIRDTDTAVQNDTTAKIVTYKPNNINVTSDDFVQQYYKGSSIISTDAVDWTVSGYKIWSWNTSADGTGTSYSAGSMPNLMANLTLYAQWVNQNAKPVTYNDNYGESIDGVLTSYSDGLKDPSTFGWSVTGSRFLGWDTNPDGSGTRYYVGYHFSMDGKPLVLYAQWCPYDSENDFYIIGNLNEWNAVFNDQHGWILGIDVNVKLNSGLINFVPNTSFTNEKDLMFTGTFDGNGQTLYNLSTALFDINEGTIKNLTVDYKYAINSSYIYVDDDAAIARTNNGTISGVTVKTQVKGTSESVNVGVICAENSGTVTDCKLTGTVSNIYATNVGGIVGKNNDTVTKCVASGTVSGLSNVGGIAGQNVDDITYCHSSATVSSAGSTSNIGGIVGYNYYNGSTTFGALQYCHAWGKVQATSSIENTNVGGLIGKSQMSSAKNVIIKCAAAGETRGGKYQGGLIGYAYYSNYQYSYTALEGMKYYTAVGQSTGTSPFCGYTSNSSGTRSYSSSENGLTLTCSTTDITTQLSNLNYSGTKWTANTGANNVSTKLKYEIVWPE